MTRTQHATLKWLADIGGVCVCWRDKVAHPYEALQRSGKGIHCTAGDERVRQLMPSVSALHLVQRGCIEARDGQLHITDKGRRELRP